MMGIGQKTRKLREAREESTARGVRIAEMKRAHQRLEHLYQISTLLTRFQNVEQTVCAIVPIIAKTLPIRSAILILKAAPVPLTLTWRAKNENDARLQEARAHAQKTYDDLVGTTVDLNLEHAETHVLASIEELEPEAEGKSRFFFLPLVVRHSEIFGALQVEDGISFDEEGLAFVNAVANQLAIAIDRQVATAGRQATAEANATEQHLLAQVGAVIAASLGPEGTLGAIARCVVPFLADLCLVDLVDEKGELRRVDVVVADEEKLQDLAQQLKHSSPHQALALASDQPELFSDGSVAEGITQDDELTSRLRCTGIKSKMILPLVARGKKLGVLTLIAAKEGRHHSAHDLTLAAEVAHRTAISIDNVRLLEHAQKATQARDDLLAIVSHDLRNPLNVIMMHLASMLQGFEREERRKSRPQLQGVHRAARRMNLLIEDLLDTVSIESGRLSVDEGRVDVGPLLSEALEAVSLLATSKSLNLVNNLPADLPMVSADARRIQQVLVNLLGNAIKFTPQGGTITVGAQHADRMVICSVTDTGPGIAEADLPHLFERLWQSKSTTGTGTGLGLFIVKGIVESHGGKVWVESKADQGSTFFFSLPVAPQ